MPVIVIAISSSMRLSPSSRRARSLRARSVASRSPLQDRERLATAVVARVRLDGDLLQAAVGVAGARAREGGRVVADPELDARDRGGEVRREAGGSIPSDRAGRSRHPSGSRDSTYVALSRRSAYVRTTASADDELAVHVGDDDGRAHRADDRRDGDTEDDERDEHLGEGEPPFTVSKVRTRAHDQCTFTWSKMPYIADTSAMATKPTTRPTTEDHQRLEQRGELVELVLDFLAVEPGRGLELVVERSGVLADPDHLADAAREEAGRRDRLRHALAPQHRLAGALERLLVDHVVGAARSDGHRVRHLHARLDHRAEDAAEPLDDRELDDVTAARVP